MRKNDINGRIGSIIHISKPFESHDGVSLNNRFMCIFSIEYDCLMLMPMSTFHSEDAKLKSYAFPQILNIQKFMVILVMVIIKCNQIYALSEEDFSNFNEIKLYNKMNKKHFEKLQNHVRNLQKDNKTKFLKKAIIFDDSPGLIKKEQIDEIETDDYER